MGQIAVWLPPELTMPFRERGLVACKVMLDLTVYLVEPSLDELEWLVDLYERYCPPDRFTKYKIAEIEFWSQLAAPDLTRSGRAAAASGLKRPYMEPVRQRIRDNRHFELRFWDGVPIDDPDGSWSFNCTRIHRRNAGQHAVMRVLTPLSTDVGLLRAMAHEICGKVEFLSGHGGLVFAYDPWLKEVAFDRIHAWAKRFWGVDIEDLNATLPVANQGIKTVSWLTLLGRALDGAGISQRALVDACLATRVADLEHNRNGYLITLGSQPIPCDVNRPDDSIDPYFQIARVLAPIFLTDHPEFAGAVFFERADSMDWIRRFIDPAGWR